MLIPPAFDALHAFNVCNGWGGGGLQLTDCNFSTGEFCPLHKYGLLVDTMWQDMLEKEFCWLLLLQSDDDSDESNDSADSVVGCFWFFDNDDAEFERILSILYEHFFEDFMSF